VTPLAEVVLERRAVSTIDLDHPEAKWHRARPGLGIDQLEVPDRAALLLRPGTGSSSCTSPGARRTRWPSGGPSCRGPPSSPSPGPEAAETLVRPLEQGSSMMIVDQEPNRRSGSAGATGCSDCGADLGGRSPALSQQSGEDRRFFLRCHRNPPYCDAAHTVPSIPVNAPISQA
jgi:hypothetical protein